MQKKKVMENPIALAERETGTKMKNTLIKSKTRSNTTRNLRVYSEKKHFTFIDLFAGIGGFRLGLEKLGGVCIASSEIEPDAKKIYGANWPKDAAGHNLGNICDAVEVPKADLIVGGVPCQSWSIAGKNMGTQDPRGRLWYEAIRFVKEVQPKAFMFENVKGLTDPRHRDSLDFIFNSFTELGYSVQYKLLNSYDFGIPQNRDRVFIVGIKKSLLGSPFKWPSPTGKHTRLSDIFDGLEKSEKTDEGLVQRNLFGERVNVGFNKLTPKGQKNSFFALTDIRNGPTSVHSWEFKKTTIREKNLCMVILKNRRKPKYGPCDGNPMRFEDILDLVPDLKQEELDVLVEKRILRKYEDGRYEFRNRRLSGGIDGVYRVFLPSSTFFPTLTATGVKDVVALVNVHGESNSEYKKNFIDRVLSEKKWRTLSPEEMARLQGFPKGFKLHNQEKKNIKLFGNSVSVPVIAAVGMSIVATGCFD